MIGHSEFPAASYDAWKTTPPDYYYADDEPECHHEEYDVDWEGRAECSHCGEHWWLTFDEHKAYDEAVRRAERAFEWEQWKMRNPFVRVWRRFKYWWRMRNVPNDDIPF
jgi:hypothetical protein